MFVLLEYAAVVALTLLVLALLFAVSAALLMVGEVFVTALRMLRRTTNTLNTRDERPGLQDHVVRAALTSSR